MLGQRSKFGTTVRPLSRHRTARGVLANDDGSDEEDDASSGKGLLPSMLTGFAKSFALSDDVGLDFSVSTGYSIDNYYTVGSFNAPTGPNASNYDFTHTLISLALPIQLTETASLTPHVTANLSHDARDAINSGVNRGDSEVYFGASFAVSF